MRIGVAVGILAFAGWVAGSEAGGDAAPFRPAPAAVSLRSGAAALDGGTARPVQWRGGRMTAATGEQLTVEISDSYAPEAVSAQAWADFFAGLLHGDELGRVTVRIATPAEVGALCGPNALGCYQAGLLVMPGETWAGITPQEIARHEYGHHLAFNRPNPPWQGVAWGPKRWSSALNVCARSTAGELHPGGGGRLYALNPGEGFAEAYRVFDERRAGVATFTWSIVDDLFVPDENASKAIELDVLQPWTAPASRTVRARFLPGRSGRWRLELLTPLDGTLTASVTVPPGRLDLLELVSDGGKVLARGLWADSRTKRVTYEICGQRRLELRVTLRGRPGPFSVSITQP